MRRPARDWWLALLLGAAAVLWLGSMLSDGGGPTGDTAVAVADPPRYTVRGARWTRSDETGAPLFSVRAEALTVFASERVAIEAPRVIGLGNHDVWSLQAPRGEVPAGTRALELTGGVTIAGQWPDGAALDGELARLTADAGNRELRSDADVRLDGPGRSMRGTGLRADWDGGRLRVLENVRMQYDDPA